MLSAILEDFQALRNVQVSTLVAPDFPHSLSVSHERVLRDEREHFILLAQQADSTLVVAPEFDDLLLTRARLVEEVGGQLLGSTPEGISQTADKLALAQLWKDHQIRTPNTSLLHKPQDERWAIRFLAVLKPRFGAGSQLTYRLHELDTSQKTNIHEAQTRGMEFVVQPYVSGLASSVAFLIGPNGPVPLSPARQLISDDGNFTYLGGEIPLPQKFRQRAISLAQRAVECVSGLRGYVGVDLILGEADDGSQDFAIEINPRLTTSYIGLRQLAETNLAEAMLNVVQGANISLSWRDGVVRFCHDGKVQD